MAAGDKSEIGVKISGDGASAIAAMQQTAGAVADGVDKMKGALSNVGEAFGKIQGYFAGLVAIVAGGKFFKEAINESNKLTGETTRLARTLGITAEEATTLNTALGDIYSDSDTYIGAFQKFAQQLRRNEDGLKDMGLATRDAKGNLRDANDVFGEAIKLVGQYKPGLDQTTAAQTLFGKSIDDVMKLQKLNNEVLEEARKKNEELGLIITDQNVAANKAYKAAMNDVNDVMTAVMKTVGDAVMPAFTELAVYLASTGPGVVNIFKGALTGLMLVFRSVQAVVKTVAGVIFEFINYTIDQVGNLSELISSVLSGDFDRAAKSAVAMKDRMVSAFRNIKNEAVDAFTGASDKFADDMDRIWSPKKAATVKQGSGTRRMAEKAEGDSGPDKEMNLKAVDARLAAQKLQFAMEHDLREMTKAEELATYTDLLSQYKLSEGEKLTAARKVSTMRLDVLREERQQGIQLSQAAVEEYKAQSMERLDAVRQEAQYKVDTGQMTQAQLIQLDQQLENERYQITKTAVEQRLEILKNDPTKNVVALQKLNDELAAVERQHAMQQRGLQLDAQKEQFKDWQGFFNSIGNAFGNVVNGLVTRTMTLGQAVKSLFSNLLASVGQFLAQMVAKRIAAWAIEKTIGASEIATNAAVAGSGAASSMASIPFVGPVLALAAMASVFAAVSGLSTKSARNGYDIPAGVNPMTQLHEQEMVLPKEQADTIRNMSGQGSGTIIIQTTGGQFIHKDDLGRLLKKMGRNFELRP